MLSGYTPPVPTPASIGAFAIAAALGELGTAGELAAARANLGLGGAATETVGTVAGTVADGGALAAETTRAKAAEAALLLIANAFSEIAAANRQGAARGNIGAAASGANGDITGLSGLTTPLSVAQGGTGDAGTGWTQVTFTPTASTGSFTSATGTYRWKAIGKTVFYAASVSIATNGSAAGAVVCPLPRTAVNAGYNQVMPGRETAVAGKELQGQVGYGGSTLTIYNGDNTYPGANGYVLCVTGSYEAA